MSTAPIPIEQFAAAIRAKHPGAYDKRNDSELVSAYVNKYPAYKDRVAGFAQTEFEKQHPGTGWDTSGKEAKFTGEGALGAAGETLGNQVGGLGKSLAGMAIAPTIYPFVSTYNALKDAYGEAGAGWQRGNGTVDKANESAISALGSLVGISAKRQAEHAERGEGGPILGEASVPAAETALGYGASKVLPAAKTAMQKAAFTPEGDLTPGAHAAFHPTSLPEYAFKKAFGPTAEPPAWETPEHTNIYGSPDFPGPMSKLSSRLPKSMRGDPFSPSIPTMEATPVPAELGSPENPGLFSKLPTRLPSNLHSDPFQPRVSPLDPTATPAEGTSRSNIDTSSQDLISRMKKIAVPGEEPTAGDLKRAGDFTQTPLSKLKALAKFGDKLAQNELNRRLRQ